jgi:hypothetical protein
MRKKRKRWRGNEGATGEGEEGGKEEREKKKTCILN